MSVFVVVVVVDVVEVFLAVKKCFLIENQEKQNS
jgi:hypothetical protein